MPFYGADINQLKSLSKKLSGGATLLDERAKELNSLINNSQHWKGHDAKQFVGDWQSVLRPLLQKTSEGIKTAAETILKNAEEQTSTSKAEAGGKASNRFNLVDFDRKTEDGSGHGEDTKLTPEEILEKYQVKDAKTTEWPSDWDPLSWFADQKTITEKEADMLNNLALLDLKEFGDIHDDAFEEADKRFESDDQNDDHNDAFRHAYWNALMVKKFGAEWAEDYATAHEQLPGNQGPREAMDLYNNEVGRNIALAHPDASSEELADLIEKAVKNGDTVVIGQDLLPHPSNEIPQGKTGDANKAPAAPGHKPDFNGKPPKS